MVRARRAGWRSAVTLGGLTALVTVMGCTDATRPVRPIGGKANADASQPVDDLPADAVSFDVDLTTTASSRPQTIRMHVDRTRGAGGRWRTSIAPVDNMNLSKRPGRHPVRVDVAENGMASAVMSDGSLGTLPDPSQPIPTVKRGARPPRLKQSSAPTRLHTEWIDGLISSAAARAREAASASAGASTHTRDAAGRDHFIRSHGGDAIEAIVDGRSGFVTERRFVKNGSTVRSVAMEYADAGSGISVRRKTEAFDEKGQSRLAISVSNVSFSPKTGAP